MRNKNYDLLLLPRAPRPFSCDAVWLSKPARSAASCGVWERDEPRRLDNPETNQVVTGVEYAGKEAILSQMDDNRICW